jgi:hypothetical protein
MTKTSKYQDFGIKTKSRKKTYIEEENISFKEVKRDKFQKQYRNYDNALRAKNLDRLLSYEDD